eukprot:CAMPEP_0202956738 /NCGR_PEP_ID=MMETSP1396-20130829/1247_1 /ASSEMBLY_ACC=CAM_ASM_000872 /TAXON_ID= /ORGANISM="Pseudokeronopsis sp., Strain Brazil" /LENGTH=180 /DNA_ID=CAMNT_0049673903 /DNA_START=164 /DNA_END=706 /DNA_ORIENTATION=+
MISIGWEFEQEYETEYISAENVQYWQIRLKPYVTTEALIQSILDFPNIYYNSLELDLNDFQANVFAEIRFYYNTYLCWGLGYEIESILMNILLSMRFGTCAKVLLQNIPFLCFDNARDEDAQGFFDDCEQSSDETIWLYTWNPSSFQTTNQGYWKGGDTYDSNKCKKLVQTAKPLFLHVF